MGASSKSTLLPARYKPGFLRELDRRSEVYKQLNDLYEEVLQDAGGRETMTRVKLGLIERYVFLCALVQTWESQIALDPFAEGNLVNRWIQAVNTIQGLSQRIGLERAEPKTIDLTSYLKSKGDDE